MSRMQPAIPVTIVSGFLGAGKTTLMNHILSHCDGLRIAVMVNDFGAINIDSDLIVAETDTMVSLANGCICCTVESDLIQQLSRLLAMKEGRPEYILIEASGVSNPAKIAATLRYPEFRDRLQIDSVLSLVDAGQFDSLTPEMAPLAMEQLDVADIVVLNKTDQASSEQIETLKQRWLYPGVRLLQAQHGQVSLELVLGTGLASKAVQTTQKTDCHDCQTGHCDSHDHDHDHDHDQGHPFDSLSWQSEQPLSLAAVRQLLANLPSSVYRAKGWLKLHEMPERPVLLHLVGSRHELKPDPHNQNAPQNSQLVMIGLKGSFDTEMLKTELDSCRMG